MKLQFEWDEKKEKINISKRGIDFETASHVFLDPNLLEYYDGIHSFAGEDRYITIGFVEDVLTVVYTERVKALRIISARIATKKGRYIMAIRKYEISADQKLTEEQVNMVREAAKRPAVPDDDNPELTDEQLALCRRVHENRQADRRRQNVTLRLTPQAIQKAKALGKGYSGILSRIVESILNDPSELSKYL